MTEQPALGTARLHLRPFMPEDAPRVRTLAGAREIADTTLNVPHPYEDGMAEAWIATHAPGWALGRLATFAIIEADAGLIGAIGLTVEPAHRRAEIGYWIGRPHWNRGYATEAARAVVAFGFEAFDLHRIQGRHLTRNPASGRVLVKAGLTYEGTLRGHLIKWGVPEDVAIYAVLRPHAVPESGAGA
ncbi:MAG: GNAT family N-acetyltransferase [Vicinamibacterales bacterium]